MQNPKFEESMPKKSSSRIDTVELQEEMNGFEKRFRQLEGAKSRLERQMEKFGYSRPFLSII